MIRRSVGRVSTTTLALLLVPCLFAGETPLSELPYTPSLDVSAMDPSADPCEDLYRYSCGGWMKNNPLPGDQASWSVYGKLYQDNQRYLWGLLLDAAQPAATRTATQQKIGDYFASCMDLEAVEAAGARPLQEDLERIAGMTSVRQLGGYLGSIHARITTHSMLFGNGVEQDARDSSRQIVALYAGGLGLPDRDYYFKDDEESRELRARYLEHVERMLALLGHGAEAAREGAAAVMRLETALARVALTRVERRDPYKVYHRTSPAKLKKLVPSFDWEAYFAAVGGRPGAWLNVTEPKVFAEIEALLNSESLGSLQSYLRWTLVNAYAEYLSAPFVDQDFAFYRATLRGVKEQQPRWKRCVDWVDRDLGEALGQEFVERVFPPQNKARAGAMTDLIVEAMRERIIALDWMSEKTKRQALDKLGQVRRKVGYPDATRDYSTLGVTRDDFFGNVSRSIAFETRRQLAKVGRPVDRDEWGMTPPTVNAYYNPSMNDINFPAGVLLPPLYDLSIDDAPNYGNTGSTIGHELTHGFDDEGRQFDGDGNLRDWWTRKDAAAFEQRAQCIRDQYADYVVVDEIKINSDLTSGEDIADLGGTLLAWSAWKAATREMPLEPIDGLTPDQRFFVGLAQWACENERPENLRLLAATNPHSPGKYRINGVVVNIPAFAEAFQCTDGAALKKAPDRLCKIW